MSVVLSSTKKVINVLTSEELPKCIQRDRGVNLLFKLFLPFLDDYLYEEGNYAENITKKHIDEWVNLIYQKKKLVYFVNLYIHRIIARQSIQTLLHVLQTNLVKHSKGTQKEA